MRTAVLFTLLLLAASVSAEIVVILYHKGSNPPAIATCYQGMAFRRIQDRWPPGGHRHITYWAVPDSYKTAGFGWTVRLSPARVKAVGDSLSPDSTYAGRFEGE